MAKATRFGFPHSNPNFRRRTQPPLPRLEEVERRLIGLIRPEHFTPLRLLRDKGRLRDRVLTLPVMVAVVLSLVSRQIASLRELVQMLEEEGLMWLEPLRVSRQAVSQRLASLPASLMADLFHQVVARLAEERATRPAVAAKGWERGLAAAFSVIWIADGSTLDALRRRLKQRQDGLRHLAGKMMMIVEAISRLPVHGWYSEDPDASDFSFAPSLLAELPKNGLLIFDMAFFGFSLFDQFTQEHKWFITRLKQKVAYDRLEVLRRGPRFRDEIIQMGKYRGRPCEHPVRLVSVRWKKTWHHYLTNVLDPEQLSTQQVVKLYRRRWRIEEAFLLTKRLLGLSYFWSTRSNGVQLQLYATWIFYAVLVDLCQQVASYLKKPLDRISVEMVFRSIYHYARAVLRGETVAFCQYLQQRQDRLGIIKALRKRHRLSAEGEKTLWATVNA